MVIYSDAQPVLIVATAEKIADKIQLDTPPLRVVREYIAGYPENSRQVVRGDGK